MACMKSAPRIDEPAAIVSRALVPPLAGFWTFWILLQTLRSAFLAEQGQGAIFVRQVFVAMIGMTLAWTMHESLMRLRPSSILAQVGWTALVSLPAAVLFASLSFALFHAISPMAGEACIYGSPCFLKAAIEFVSATTIDWWFVFGAWGLLDLSLASAARASAAGRLAAAHREAARQAEIRALRYQVNPHFLFNILNSISALVMQRNWSEAEMLIGECGRFFRSSLEIDPMADSTLADEIEMQMRYLSLEKRRFPARLKTEYEIPDALGTTSIPSLILQPLVENAVKHGVSRTSSPVTISIRASEDPGDRLRIVVEDDAARDPAETPGLGIGLKNVADRLRMRFGAQASHAAGPKPGGGYRVELLVPLVREQQR